MSSQQLSVKQAIELGYEHFFYSSYSWQSLKSISDISEIDFAVEGGIVLVDKDPSHPCAFDSTTIADILANEHAGSHYDETKDDTDSVYDAIIDLDFSEASKKIQEALSKINYYKSTGIKLVP